MTDDDIEAPSSEAPAVIQVLRRRPIWLHLFVKHLVFIDGTSVGTAKGGKFTQFAVTPGAHKVRVWLGNVSEVDSVGPKRVVRPRLGLAFRGALPLVDGQQ
jgi:hypothetical protein